MIVGSVQGPTGDKIEGALARLMANKTPARESERSKCLWDHGRTYVEFESQVS